MTVKFLILAGALAFLYTGCASLAETDRNYVNRPAMDLRTRRTPDSVPSFTQLDSVKNGNSGGACTTCAH